MVRLYIPLDETERYLDPVTKRVNIAAVNPDDLLDVSRIQRYTLRLRRLTLVPDRQACIPTLLHERQTRLPLVYRLRR